MEPQTKHRPRTKPPEERRADLMNAAEALFLEKGVAATPLEEITIRAGIAKGSFYLHFSSKEEIHVALGERFQQRCVAEIDKAVARCHEDDWKGKLAAWAEAMVATHTSDAALVNMLFHSHPHPPDGRPNVIVEHLVNLLTAGASAGAWSVSDPRFTALFLFGGAHSVVDDVLLGNEPMSADDIATRTQQLFFHVLQLPTD